jgi:large subunit ribosomal protein L17
MIANMLKALIENERIETTLTKAKELKRYIDKVITLAKKDDVVSKRALKSLLMIRFNALTPKEKRRAKNNDFSAYNTDRKIFSKLVELKNRFQNKKSGYTRIVKKGFKVGDRAPLCYIEFVEEEPLEVEVQKE